MKTVTVNGKRYRVTDSYGGAIDIRGPGLRVSRLGSEADDNLKQVIIDAIAQQAAARVSFQAFLRGERPAHPDAIRATDAS